MTNEQAYNSFKRKRNIYGHEITLPEPPPIDQIQNYGLPIKQQKFKADPFPEDFDEWTNEDRIDYVESEWYKIRNGLFFFNGGQLEYITGKHYFYVRWWKIKVSEDGKPKRMGLPSFIDADRDFFLVFDKAEKDPLCGGLVFITNRRDGKSYKAGVLSYLAAITNPNSHVGMQSKTERDAKGVLKKIIEAWKHLPYIFRPKDSGDTNPQKSLRFEPSSKKDNKTSIKERRNGKDYINSYIDYESSDSYAYDGDDQIFYILDEFGKPQKNDTNETLRVVLETMVDGTTVTGKMLAITTVEDIEGTTEDEGVKGIWNGADETKLNEYGQTKNSLIRYFKPAYMGLRGKDKNLVPFINEFGYTDWRRAKAYLEGRRRALEGAALTSYIRKYPFDIKEAFQTTEGCYFNDKHLHSLINYNKQYVNETNLHRGNFHWKTSIDNPEVWWKPDPEGRFLVSWFPDVKDRNQYVWHDTEFGRQRGPKGIECRAGLDPFDHMFNVDGKPSNAALYIGRRSGSWDGDETKVDPLKNVPVLEYVCRPPAPEDMYEDVLKAVIFYGATMLPEHNKIGLNNFFRINGYRKYLMERPESTHSNYSKKRTKEVGIALSGNVPRKHLPDRVMTYIHHDACYKETGEPRLFIPFNTLLTDLLRFRPSKWTEFDPTVAFMLMMTAMDVDLKPKVEYEYTGPMLQEWDNSGEISRPIN